jgi:hypothetical protein
MNPAYKLNKRTDFGRGVASAPRTALVPIAATWELTGGEQNLVTLRPYRKKTISGSLISAKKIPKKTFDFYFFYDILFFHGASFDTENLGATWVRRG